MAGRTSFHRLLWDDAEVIKDGPIKLQKDAKIRRVVLCSGKVYYDLLEEREKRGIDDVYLLRVEQLYPFPAKALINELSRFRNAEWSGARKSRRTWAHGRSSTLSGMGACHIDAKYQRVRYTGRPAAASPATGLMSKHLAQLAAFLEDALGRLTERKCEKRPILAGAILSFCLNPSSKPANGDPINADDHPAAAGRLKRIKREIRMNMATEIRVPTLGESVSEATVGTWFKKVGDAVKADEPLSSSKPTR
jgi:hypothetical protein